MSGVGGSPIQFCALLTLTVTQPAVANLLPPSGNKENPSAAMSAYSLADQNWPISQFATLADQLSDGQVVFSGSPEDRSVIEQAIARDGNRASINLAGRLSLIEFFALVAGSDVVITGDSLPMHVASAFDRPLVALFGPTNEDLVGPRNTSARVIRADMDCQRCYRRRRCPRACIAAIPVDEVCSAIQGVLGSQHA